MHPAIMDAYAADVRRERERAAASRALAEQGTRVRRSHRGSPRARLGRALIAAGTRLAH